MDEKVVDLKEVLEEAKKNEGVSQIYFNGFSTAISAGDIIITLSKNGKPVSIVNTSYTVAKTLAIKLGEAINYLESKTDNKIMTIDFIDEKVGRKDLKNDKQK